jgi:hypothetical protein
MIVMGWPTSVEIQAGTVSIPTMRNESYGWVQDVGIFWRLYVQFASGNVRHHREFLESTSSFNHHNLDFHQNGYLTTTDRILTNLG